LQIIFLGTNGWYSTNSGNTICTLIDSEEFYIILDAGDGINKLDKYVKKDKRIILFLSHMHLDHIIGLHILNKFRFKDKVSIYGYKGTKNGLKKIMRHPYTASIKEMPFEIEIFDLLEGRHESPFTFDCKLLIHSDLCLGYRIKLKNKVLTYCTDTGICDNLYDLAKNADLLICECSFKPGQSDWKWPHLAPEDAANIAKNAKVMQLALTHFDANVYKTVEDRKQAEISAKKIFPKTIAAYDNLIIEI